jgi:hypothetical protein
MPARTLNNHRLKDPPKQKNTTQGTGNPQRGLEERTRQELYNRARQLKIQGRSKMSKADLIEAIRDQP